MDDTAVANMVLSAIGTRSDITSLGEQSPEAIEVAKVYAQTRDELLRKYTWRFANDQLALVVSKAAQGTPENPNGTLAVPRLPWRYSYSYPARCLKARYILPYGQPAGPPGVPLVSGGLVSTAIMRTRRDAVPFEEAVDYDTQGNPFKVVLTNQYQAQLVFTARITDPTIWDTLFVTAFVGRMAKKLAQPLTGDKTLVKIAIQAGTEAEGEAAEANANEGITILDHTPEWIAARGYPEDGEATD